MELRDALRAGMRVVGPDHREYGTIERYDDAAAYVQGKRAPYAAIGRMERDRLYVETPELWGLSSPGVGDATLRGGAPAGADHDPRASADLGGEIRVPLLEEQLAFAAREIDLGEIRVHKTVEASEETRTGQLNREDVEVERVRVDRRVTEPEVSRQEGDWLIIPVMEEVFAVEKRLMVTEEIRIRKRLVTEDAEVRETVRRERATVEDTASHARRSLPSPSCQECARTPLTAPPQRTMRRHLAARRQTMMMMRPGNSCIRGFATLDADPMTDTPTRRTRTPAA